MDGAISALADIGISVRNSAGEMRSVDDILKDLASQWNGLSKAQQQNLGLQIAGRYQLSRFLILMQQFDTAMSASQTAVESNGSAFGENEKYLNSYEAKLNALANSWTKFVTVLNEDILGSGIVGISAMLTGLTNSVSFVVDKFGALPPLFGIIATSFLALNKSTRDAIMGQGLLATSFVRTGDSMTIASGKSKLLQSQLYNLTLTTRAVASGASLMGNAFKTAFTFISRAIIPIAGFIALGEAISYVTKKITDHKQQQEEMNRKLEDYKQKNIEAVSVNREQVEELIEQYKKLSVESQKDNWNTQKEEEYLQIQQKLGELFPSTIAYIDSKGKSHLKTVDAIEKEIEANEKLMKAENDQYVRDAKGRYQEKIDDIEKLRKEYNAYQEDLNSYNNQKKQEEMFPNIKNGIENLDGYISDAETKMTIIESMIANSATAINSEVVSTFDRLLTTLSAKVTPQIQKEMENIIGSLDFSKMKVDDIQKVSEQIVGFTVRLQEAFDSEDSKGFNKITEDFIKYINTLPNGEQAVKGITGSYDDLKTSVDNANESQKEAQKITDATSDSLGGLEGAADGAAEGMEKLASASERIAGFSSKQVDSVFELIGTYQALNGVQDRTKEQNQLLESTLEALSSQYPNLVKNKEVNIEAIRKEAEQNDLLLKALDKVNSGQATSEEVRTVNAMLGAKNRLKLMGNEVEGLKQLMDAYAKAAESAMRQAQSFYSQGLTAEAESAQMAASANIGMSRMAGDAYQAQQSLDGLASKLAEMVDYNGQVYKSANQVSKAKDKASKSTDKLAKSYENATYVSDKFKQQLEKINAQLREQQSIQKSLPNDSAKYISSLQTELKLQEQKKKVLEAQSKELEKQIKSGKIQQTGVITTTTKSTTSSSYSKATGGSTQDIIWNFFKQKGLSDSAVAGIMGNLQLESNFNPSAVNKSSGATGIAQWLGGRLTGLKSYAKSIGTAYTDLNTQLQWLWKELNSTENKTLKYLQSNSGSSASTLAAGFERLFERSGGAAVGTRQGYANNIYSKYSGKTVAVSSSGNTSKEVAQGMADIDSAKSELLQLQSDILDIQDTINQLNADIVNAKVNQYENLIAGVDRSIQKSEAMMKQYTSTSAEYRKELDLQASKLKYKQDLMHKEAEYLRQQIASGKLSAAQVAEYTVKVSELSIAWWDVKEALDNVKFDKMTSHLDIYKENVEDLNKELELSQAIMSTYNEDSEEYRNEIQKQITLTQRKIKETQDEAKAIKKLMETEKLSAIQKKALQDRLDELTKSYWDLTSVIKSNEEALLRQREEFADKAIDTIKKAYETERDYKSKLIEQQMDEAEKAHQRQLEMYDEDLRAYEDSINQKLRLIDDQASEDEYNEQLNGLLKEQKDLQSQIFTLSLDDSQESALKRHELEQQLDDKVKEIEKLKKNRNKDLRKQDLNDQLDAYQKDVEAKKKAEDKKYEMERDRLEREKRDNEYYYNELIANESQFQSMREDIIQNGTNNIQGILSQFLEAFKNMNVQVIKEIGMSWQDLQNQIGNMEGLPSKYPSTPPSSNDNNNTTEPIISQRDQAWQQYLQNKLNWETASAAKKKQLQKENEAMREKWKFPDGSYDALKNLKTYHTGGIVGGKETNDTKLIKSFLDLKPNEEFAKLLNEEVVLSKPQVPNLANNIRSLLSSFTPKQMTGGIIQIDNLVNIGNVTKDANINIKQLVKEASNELVNQMRPYGFRL